MPSKTRRAKPSLTYAAWREAQNARSLARLRRALPATFPRTVLHHALTRRFTPPTPRRAVESYWRNHPLRADKLARALAQKSGAPKGWMWRLAEPPPRKTGGRKGKELADDAGLALSFRAPPAPYRETAFKRGPGFCCVCGQPVFRFGWHVDLWFDGKPNRQAAWHAACVTAWELWNGPRAYLRLLRKRQGPKCPTTGKRLLLTGEVDHAMPLYRVWREHRSKPWPELLGYWGLPNLQVVNRDAHRAKCAAEAAERTLAKKAAGDERAVAGE